ncbi:hypothetical protein SAMN05192533_105124 [Mesobacillus persicus]|uniref:Uncharacterized protein n=1 Tax=Mesobacillus persicus TaxID=930146 RepID=A0A1H8AUM2_9BACI|nr:hypothetical protein [Mesobacillus persicus]SEM73207.1 hypothetical protein SAMN05192533_105124 [Mesobacillus persicus]
MRQNQKDLRERIKRAKEKSKHAAQMNANEENQADDELGYDEVQQGKAGQILEQGKEQDGVPNDKGRGFHGKQLKGMKRLGYLAIAIGVVAMFFTNTATVDTSESAKNALENQVSTGISAGVVLLQEDENLGAQDYTITHSSDADETKIWVWDYAAEDGDYVQVLVDGTPSSESFMIQHQPKELMVPSTGSVQIKGIRDGGGGITYAVRYDMNGTSYFNTAPEGEFNTYELVRE